MQKTAARAIQEALADEQRRVFADWRALIVLRRATFSLPSPARRWSHLPTNVAQLVPILRQMQTREEITPIRALKHLYQVTVPYATSTPLSEYEILMEAHPYCMLSHSSALGFHGLTNDLEQEITATAPSRPPSGYLPSGTVVEDWEGLKRPVATRAPQIGGRSVKWVQVEIQHFFGGTEYHRFGYPLRVTDRERTLLDGLRSPDLCGGLDNVLQAWAASRDVMNLDALCEYADRLDITVLRQRAGFILETLGLSHPLLDSWQHLAKRGGSSKLLGSAPYSPANGDTQWSERWKLAINAPITALQGTAK